MKNYKKIAAVLGIAVMITGQSSVIAVQAQEASLAVLDSSVQKAADNVRLGSDYNVYFTSEGSGENIGFRGTLSCPDGRKLGYDWYDKTSAGNIFYTFENITESGDYAFVVSAYDKSTGKTIEESEITWTYTRPGGQLSAPEDLAWSEEGILTFKEVPNATQYSFDVYDSSGRSVIGSFGSNTLGPFMKDDNGYKNINLNKYMSVFYNISIGNGYSVKVRATSTNIDNIAHGSWSTVTYHYGSAVSVERSEKTPVRKACEHEYEWVTERDATVIANGEEIYQCKYCGDVKERMEMANSAYAKFNKDAIQAIDRAPLNGTVTIKTDMWVSFYASVIDTLRSRPDVTVVLSYFYKGTRYTMTIPAGADLSALVESEGYYGFRYLDTFFPGQEVK